MHASSSVGALPRQRSVTRLLLPDTPSIARNVEATLTAAAARLMESEHRRKEFEQAAAAAEVAAREAVGVPRTGSWSNGPAGRASSDDHEARAPPAPGDRGSEENSMVRAAAVIVGCVPDPATLPADGRLAKKDSTSKSALRAASSASSVVQSVHAAQPTSSAERDNALRSALAAAVPLAEKSTPALTGMPPAGRSGSRNSTRSPQPGLGTGGAGSMGADSLRPEDARSRSPHGRRSPVRGTMRTPSPPPMPMDPPLRTRRRDVSEDREVAALTGAMRSPAGATHVSASSASASASVATGSRSRRSEADTASAGHVHGAHVHHRHHHTHHSHHVHAHSGHGHARRYPVDRDLPPAPDGRTHSRSRSRGRSGPREPGPAESHGVADSHGVAESHGVAAAPAAEAGGPVIYVTRSSTGELDGRPPGTMPPAPSSVAAAAAPAADRRASLASRDSAASRTSVVSQLSVPSDAAAPASPSCRRLLAADDTRSPAGTAVAAAAAVAASAPAPTAAPAPAPAAAAAQDCSVAADAPPVRPAALELSASSGGFLSISAAGTPPAPGTPTLRPLKPQPHRLLPGPSSGAGRAVDAAHSASDAAASAGPSAPAPVEASPKPAAAPVPRLDLSVSASVRRDAPGSAPQPSAAARAAAVPPDHAACQAQRAAAEHARAMAEAQLARERDEWRRLQAQCAANEQLLRDALHSQLQQMDVLQRVVASVSARSAQLERENDALSRKLAAAEAVVEHMNRQMTQSLTAAAMRAVPLPLPWSAPLPAGAGGALPPSGWLQAVQQLQQQQQQQQQQQHTGTSLTPRSALDVTALLALLQPAAPVAASGGSGSARGSASDVLSALAGVDSGRRAAGADSDAATIAELRQANEQLRRDMATLLARPLPSAAGSTTAAVASSASAASRSD